MSLLVDQWVPEGTCSQVLWSTLVVRSVWRASKLFVLKLIENGILWVYHTIPVGFSLFWHFWQPFCNVLNYFVWLRITDEGSGTRNTHIWSILLFKFEWIWCINIFVEVLFYIMQQTRKARLHKMKMHVNYSGNRREHIRPLRKVTINSSKN